MDEKLLSVIIPAYNAERYLEETVLSVRKQRWEGNTELLLVNDGSADRTEELAERLGCTVLNKEHAGAASARNAGIRASNGAWILFLDADDTLHPDAVDELYRPFLNDPTTAAVFGRALDHVSPELTPEQRSKLKKRDGSYGGILPGCSLIRRKVFDQIGLFDESLQSGETVEWMVRLRSSGLKTAEIEAVTLNRRLHPDAGRPDPVQQMRNYALILRKRMKKHESAC